MTGPRFHAIYDGDRGSFESFVNQMLSEGYRILSCSQDRDGYYAFMLHDPEPLEEKEDEKP